MKHRRTSNRRDRNGSPHSRIPDAIYYDVLPFLTAYETKLWLALKSREWRKDGTRRGIVRKSLNQVAKDIRMSRATAQRAFHGLRTKGVLEWAGFGIRLLEPDFTTAFTTPFTTEGVAHIGPGVAHQRAGAGPPAGRVGHLSLVPSERLGVGDPYIRSGTRGRSPARAVDIPKVSASIASRGKARASAEGSRALPANAEDAKRKSEASMEERPLSREEAQEFLKRIRSDAESAAARATEERSQMKDSDLEWKKKQEEKEREQIARLRVQARMLQEEEGKPK